MCSSSRQGDYFLLAASLLVVPLLVRCLWIAACSLQQLLG